MFKPNNKKMLTVLIAVAMIFSAFAILSFAAEPAYAASGSFTTTPTVFAISSSTVVGFSARSTATFSSGSTVTFYVNTVNTFPTGAIEIGSLTLSPGATTLTASTTTFDTASLSVGTYYLAATDGSGFASGGTITVTSLTPEISLSGSTAAGGTAYVSSVTGHPFDPSSTVNVYLNYSGSSDLLISSIAVGTSGYLPTNATTGTPSFKVPMLLPEGTYNVVAEESLTSSPAPNSQGITADASFFLTPSITVTISGAHSISGAASSQFTIQGNGFAASATIAASPSTAPTNSVTVAGIDAILAAGTSTGTTGEFSLSVIGLASAISSTGPQTIVVTTAPATTSNTFPDAIYVSQQTGTPSITITDTSTGTNSGYVGDTVEVVAYNFLDSSAISVILGNISLVAGTTDQNGFFSSTGSIVNMTGGSYTAFAKISSSSVVTEYASTTFKVLPEVTFTLAGYYAATGASARVTGTGLSPNTEYAVTDTGYVSDGGTGNIVYDFYVLGIGSITNTTGSIATDYMGVVSTFTGLFSITYSIEYFGLSTGANQTVTTTGGSLSPQSSYYFAIGPATVTSSSASYNPAASPSQTATITVSGLIPDGSLVAGVGVSSSYSLLLSSNNGTSINKLIFVSANGAASSKHFTTTSGSTVLTFGADSTYIPIGADVLAVAYENTTGPLGSANVTGSTPGATAGSTYSYISNSPAGAMLGLYLYDYPASTSVAYYFYTTQGKQSFTISTDSNGAANLSFSSPLTPAGAYHLATYVTVSGLTTYHNTTFAITAALSSVPTTNSSYPLTSTTSVLYPNQNLTLYAYGLSPQTNYGIYAYNLTAGGYISMSALAYFTTDTSGSYSSGVTVTLPAMTSGDSISLDALPATSTPVHANAQATFTFTAGTYNNIFGPTFNYTTNTESAFPGQLVNFAWVLPSHNTPEMPGGGSGAGPVYVTVLLNGTAYTTLPANVSVSSGVYTLSGSFAMPNNDTGAYWTITLEWTQVIYSSTAPAVDSYMMPGSSAPTLALVSGAGALIVGISTSGLASIVSNAVTSAFKVPLKELNASIASINGLTANITTAFGKMTTTLSAINATVEKIKSGLVLVQTDLGTVQTSLASLNASLKTVSGNVATISTSLGQVQTSISSIGMTVNSTASSVSGLVGSVATINTDLGTLSGTVTSINNGVATIQTSLGNLTTSVSQIHTSASSIQSSSGTLEIFLIVVVVLVLITLVIAFLAVSNTNKLAKRFEEQKKQ